ncbi:MAG: hypothetical protein GF398_01785 [Chitinivibrionales bacterium]|nr:hypothetical protein [Chitinivibrionales bacterium]
MSFRLIFMNSVLCIVFFAMNSIAGLSEDIKSLTGKQYARVVWGRGTHSNEFGFPDENYTSSQLLAGYDTEGGEITLQSSVGNYQRPLISKHGNFVIFSDVDSIAVYKAEWGTDSPRQKIASGLAGCLWYDEAREKEYAYYAKDCGLVGECDVYRVNINDTSEKEIVLDVPVAGINTVDGHWLTVTSDAKVISSVWGWNIGIWPADIAQKKKLGNTVRGCWVTLPYDTVPKMLLLNMDHTAIRIFDYNLNYQINEIPTGKIDHLKFASYSNRILVCARGMNDEGSSEGGYITMIRMNDSLTGIDNLSDTLRISSTLTDGFPDAWLSDTPPLPVSIKYDEYQKRRNMISSKSHGEVKAFTIRGRRIRRYRKAELIKSAMRSDIVLYVNRDGILVEKNIIH